MKLSRTSCWRRKGHGHLQRVSELAGVEAFCGPLCELYLRIAQGQILDRSTARRVAVKVADLWLQCESNLGWG